MTDLKPLTGSSRFTVTTCSHLRKLDNGKYEHVPGFRGVAFPAHFTDETDSSEDEAVIRGWVDRLNAGESVPEANCKIYADRD